MKASGKPQRLLILIFRDNRATGNNFQPNWGEASAKEQNTVNTENRGRLSIVSFSGLSDSQTVPICVKFGSCLSIYLSDMVVIDWILWDTFKIYNLYKSGSFNVHTEARWLPSLKLIYSKLGPVVGPDRRYLLSTNGLDHQTLIRDMYVASRQYDLVIFLSVTNGDGDLRANWLCSTSRTRSTLATQWK